MIPSSQFVACRKDGDVGQRKETKSASVSMIHHVPELIVSNEVSHHIRVPILELYRRSALLRTTFPPDGCGFSTSLFQLAKQLGTKDQEHVLSARKLVLLVDLDQTIIHTTNKPHGPDIEGVRSCNGCQSVRGCQVHPIRDVTSEDL